MDIDSVGQRTVRERFGGKIRGWRISFPGKIRGWSISFLGYNLGPSSALLKHLSSSLCPQPLPHCPASPRRPPGGRERPGRSGREPARAQTLLRVPRPLPSPFPSSALSFAADFSCLGLAQRGCYVAGRGRGGDPRPRWGENSCPRKPEGALGGWVAGRSRGLGASRQADSWLGTRTRRRGSGIYVVYETRPQLLAARSPPPASAPPGPVQAAQPAAICSCGSSGLRQLLCGSKAGSRGGVGGTAACPTG